MFLKEIVKEEKTKLDAYASTLEEWSKHNKYVRQVLSLPKNSISWLLSKEVDGIKDYYTLILSLKHALDDNGYYYSIVRLEDFAKKNFHKRLKEKARQKLGRFIESPSDFYRHEIREGDWVDTSIKKEDGFVKAVFLTKEHLENILESELESYKFLLENKHQVTNPLSDAHNTWREMEKEVDNYMRKVIDNA